MEYSTAATWTTATRTNKNLPYLANSWKLSPELGIVLVFGWHHAIRLDVLNVNWLVHCAHVARFGITCVGKYIGNAILWHLVKRQHLMDQS